MFGKDAHRRVCNVRSAERHHVDKLLVSRIRFHADVISSKRSGDENIARPRYRQSIQKSIFRQPHAAPSPITGPPHLPNAAA